jgi:hypothetical protein
MTSLHIRLEQPEAISIKKNLLYLEKDLLETAKRIRNYNSLRKQEFVVKTKLKKDFDILNQLMASIENELPKEETAPLLKENRELKKQTEKIEVKKQVLKKTIEKKDSIEEQINEIKAKLAMLE